MFLLFFVSAEYLDKESITHLGLFHPMEQCPQLQPLPYHELGQYRKLSRSSHRQTTNISKRKGHDVPLLNSRRRATCDCNAMTVVCDALGVRNVAKNPATATSSLQRLDSFEEQEVGVCHWVGRDGMAKGNLGVVTGQSSTKDQGVGKNVNGFRCKMPSPRRSPENSRKLI
jgi:hypothetical protein